MLEDVKQLQFLANSNFQVIIVLAEYEPGDERFLSSQDLVRYRSILNDTRRKELAAGRKAALEAARLLSGSSVEGELHIYSENKIPKCSDSSISISLAHKHGKVVAVASSRPVGIDLEMLKEIRYAAIRNRICSEGESEMLEHLALGEELSFFLIFSIKEAAFKVYSSQGAGVEVLSDIEVQHVSLGEGGYHFSTIFEASFGASILEGRSVVVNSWVVSLAWMPGSSCIVSDKNNAGSLK